MLLLTMATITACTTESNNLNKIKDSLKTDSLKKVLLAKNSLTRDSLRKSLSDCIPEEKDTTLAKTDMSVKYVMKDTSYDVQIRIHQTEKSLGYGFDCDAPLTIVPHFDWANKHILSLIRGCGSNCLVNYYYQIRNDSIYMLERQNVFCYDKNTNLIAYPEQGDNSTVIIENIYNNQKLPYKISYEDGCEYFFGCYTKSTFKGNILLIELFGIKGGAKYKYYRKIVFSKKLISDE